MIPTVIISARGEAAAARRPSVDLSRRSSADVRAEPGDVVAVRGPRGRPLGHALYSDRSQIALRMLTRGEEPADDRR